MVMEMPTTKIRRQDEREGGASDLGHLAEGGEAAEVVVLLEAAQLEERDERRPHVPPQRVRVGGGLIFRRLLKGTGKRRETPLTPASPSI